MKPLELRYMHAGDLSTQAAHALVWDQGGPHARYQEIAVAGDRVVGAWSYSLDWVRGKPMIDSGHTGVSRRYQRRGVARALWLAGIQRWSPVRITASIGSDQGRDFLARMTAELAFRAPDLFVWITRREEDENAWSERCQNAAEELLKKLGRLQAKSQAIAKSNLKLIKAAP